MTETSNTSNQPTLLTVRQFSEKHPAFSQGSLRNLIFNSKSHYTTCGENSGTPQISDGASPSSDVCTNTDDAPGELIHDHECPVAL